MTELIQIQNLRDYTKCSNYAKYNWNATSNSTQSITRSIIDSCYRDIAVLNKTVDWKTIRNRTYKEVFKEPNRSVDTLYKDSLVILNALRNWYLEFYRDLSCEAICNITLQETISGETITAKIDTVLVSEKEVTLIEFSDTDNIEDILKDIGLRTKIYLLGKEQILVNKVLVIKTSNNNVTCTRVSVHNPVEWNYKTRLALQVIVGSIRQKIFYPSPTSMCTACPYRGICSW